MQARLLFILLLSFLTLNFFSCQPKYRPDDYRGYYPDRDYKNHHYVSKRHEVKPEKPKAPPAKWTPTYADTSGHAAPPPAATPTTGETSTVTPTPAPGTSSSVTPAPDQPKQADSTSTNPPGEVPHQ